MSENTKLINHDLCTDYICRVRTAHLTTTDSVKIDSLRKSCQYLAVGAG